MVFNGISGLTKQLNIAMCTNRCVMVPTNIATWYLKDKIRWTEETKDIANVPSLVYSV